MALRWVKELEHVLKEMQKELSCFDLEKKKLNGIVSISRNTWWEKERRHRQTFLSGFQ